MDGRKYQRKSGIKRTLVMLLALVLMTSAFIPGLTARAAEEPATPPEGEEETLTLEKVLENPPTDYETSTEYLNNLDTLVQKLDVDCTKDDCKALYDAVVKAQALIAELTLTEEQETAFTKLAEDILTCLKEEKGYKPEEEEEITPLSDPEPTPDPVCPGDDTCTIEGCTNHAPKCPGDDTCTIEGCTNHAPKCPGDETCTIEGCTNHAPKCPGDDTCTIEGCTNHAPKCPGDDTCTIEGCTNHAPQCPGDDTCTIEGCPNHEQEAEETLEPIVLAVPPIVQSSPSLLSLAENGNTTPTTTAGSEGLTITKMTHPRNDGTFDLELTLKGSVGTESEKQKLDLILVIDRSQSMNPSSGEDRIGKAKEAANALLAAMNNNDAVDARYNIVYFSGSGHPKMTDDHIAGKFDKYVVKSYGWKGYGDAIQNVSKIALGDSVTGATNPSNDSIAYSQSSTNYEAAFIEVKNQLANKRSDALSAVVFLTDGKPTVAWQEIRSDWIPGRGWVEDDPPIDGWDSRKKDGYTWKNGYIIGTDGYGTHANWEKYGTTLESPRNVMKCLNAALDDVAAIQADFMFLVGMGSADEGTLNTIKNWASGVKDCSVKKAEAYTDIVEIFKNIAEKLNNLFYTEVGVTDILRHSDGDLVVDLVGNADTVLVSVYNGDQMIAGPATSVTLQATDNNKEAELKTSYDTSTHQLNLAFPSEYKLEPTYTYKMSTVIQPTEKAYQLYRASGYNGTGEIGTGELSGQAGFYANDSAMVNYNYSGKPDQKKPYAYPVVQLQIGTLNVVKKFEGLTDTQISELEESLSFAVQITYPADTSNNEESVVEKRTILLKDMTKNEDGTYSSAPITGLSPGTQFVVTESGGEVAEYTMTTEDAGIAAAGDTCITEGDGKCAENCVLHSKITNSSNSDKTVSGTVGRGKEVTAQFTNTYSIAVTSVTVEKQVTGNMGDPNKAFSFTASLKDAEGKTLSMAGITYALYQKNAKGEYEEVPNGDGKISDADYRFNLKHDQKIVFTGVKISAEMTVTESADGYTATYSVDGATSQSSASATFTVKNDGNTVAFNNTKNANIDTGIVTDSLPYILLLTIAVIGAGVLLLNKRRVF